MEEVLRIEAEMRTMELIFYIVSSCAAFIWVVWGIIAVVSSIRKKKVIPPISKNECMQTITASFDGITQVGLWVRQQKAEIASIELSNERMAFDLERDKKQLQTPMATKEPVTIGDEEYNCLQRYWSGLSDDDKVAKGCETVHFRGRVLTLRTAIETATPFPPETSDSGNGEYRTKDGILAEEGLTVYGMSPFGEIETLTVMADTAWAGTDTPVCGVAASCKMPTETCYSTEEAAGDSGKEG